MRSNVVLPQPDGPTSAMNSPAAISRSTCLQRPGLAEAARDAADGDRRGHGRYFLAKYSLVMTSATGMVFGIWSPSFRKPIISVHTSGSMVSGPFFFE